MAKPFVQYYININGQPQLFTFDAGTTPAQAAQLVNQRVADQQKAAADAALFQARETNNAFTNAFSRGMAQMPGVFKYFGGMASKMVGADETGRRLTEAAAKDLMEAEQAHPTLYDSFIESPGGYLAELAGGNLPNMLGVGAGAAAGVGARKVATGMAKKFAKEQAEEAAKEGAKRAALEALKNNAGTLGATAVAYPMQAGETFGEQVRRVGYDDADAGMSALTAVPATALDVYSFGKLGKAFEPKALTGMTAPELTDLAGRSALRTGLAEAGKGALRTGAREGLTEAAQEALKYGSFVPQFGAEPFMDPEVWKNIGEAGLGGALLGKTMGGAGGAFRGLGLPARAQGELDNRSMGLDEFLASPPVTTKAGLDEALPAMQRDAIDRGVARGVSGIQNAQLQRDVFDAAERSPAGALAAQQAQARMDAQNDLFATAQAQADRATAAARVGAQEASQREADRARNKWAYQVMDADPANLAAPFAPQVETPSVQNIGADPVQIARTAANLANERATGNRNLWDTVPYERRDPAPEPVQDQTEAAIAQASQPSLPGIEPRFLDDGAPGRRAELIGGSSDFYRAGIMDWAARGLAPVTAYARRANKFFQDYMGGGANLTDPETAARMRVELNELASLAARPEAGASPQQAAAVRKLASGNTLQEPPSLAAPTSNARPRLDTRRVEPAEEAPTLFGQQGLFRENEQAQATPAAEPGPGPRPPTSTLREALTELSSTSKDNGTVRLAQRLLDTLGPLADNVVAFNMTDRTAPGMGEYKGTADGKYGMIGVYKGAKDANRLTETLLHEAVHAALVNHYNTNTEFARKVNKLMDEARRKLGKRADSEFAAAFKDGDEFLAEAMTWGELRQALQQRAPDLLQRIIDLIKATARKLLGREPDLVKRIDALLDGVQTTNLSVPEQRGGRGAESVSPFDRSAAEPLASTSAFQRWFAGSKVVDENGAPLVVYHGTSKDVDFNKFKIGPRGAWFTTDPEIASMYAKENDSQDTKYDPDTRTFVDKNYSSRVMPVYLRFVNPYTFTADDHQRLNQHNYAKAQRDFFTILRAKGYDGVIMGSGDKAVWVALGSPTQIKSAIGNRGTYDLNDQNMVHAAQKPFRGTDQASVAQADRERFDALTAQAREGAANRAAEALASAGDMAEAVAGRALDLTTMATLMGRVLKRNKVDMANPIERVLRTAQMRRSTEDALRQTMRTDAIDPLLKLRRKAPAVAKRAEELAVDLSYARYNPGDTNATRKKAAALRSPNPGEIAKLDARYAALPADAKAAIQAVFKATEASFFDFKRAAMAHAEGVVRELTDAGRSQEAIRRAQQWRGFLQTRLDAMGGLYPFVPFTRLAGDHMLAYTLKDGTQGVRAFETARERDHAFREAGKTGQYSRITSFEKHKDPSSYLSAIDAVTGKFASTLRELRGELSDLDRSGGTVKWADVMADIETTLADLVATNAPFGKFADRMTRRENFLGAETDLVASLSDYAITAGRALSNVRHGQEMGRAYRDLGRLAEAGSVYTDGTEAAELAGEDDKGRLLLPPDARDALRPLTSAMFRQYDFIMRPSYAAWSGTLSKLGYIAMLGLNPSSAAMQLMQLPMMQLPVLSRYGWSQATSAMFNAANVAFTGRDSLSKFVRSGDVFRLADYDEKYIDDAGRARQGATGSTVEYSKLRTSSKPAERYKAMLVDMARRGMLNDMAAADMPSLRRGENPDSISNKVDVIAGGMMHYAENVNRLVSTVAAFDLARGKVKDWNKLMDTVAKDVYEAHGDYSAINSPEVFKSNFGRVALLFKKFAFHMYTQMGMYLKDSMDKANLTAAERAEARQKLGGVLIMSLALAGVGGLPLMGLAKSLFYLFQQMFGDDDETRDLILALRQAAEANGMSNDASAVMMAGLPRLLGANLSGRIGYSDMLFRDPDENLDSTSLGKWAFETAFGPLAGYTQRVATGVGAMADGKPEGLADLLPSGLRNLFKAYQQSDQGAVLTRRGDVITEIDAMDAFWQAVGFPAAKVGEQYQINTAAKNIERRVEGRRKSILEKYRLGHAMGDSDLMDEAQAEADEFNTWLDERGADKRLQVTKDSLERSVRAAEATNLLIQNGVRLSERTRPFTDPITSLSVGD